VVRNIKTKVDAKAAVDGAALRLAPPKAESGGTLDGPVSGPVVIDERADERQAEVLPLIFGGRAGRFPAQVAALFTEGRQVRGVERARITFEIAPDRAHWGAEIAGKVKAWAKARAGPGVRLYRPEF
jgi:hypothetical protein